MQVPIFRLSEQGQFILYRRERTKFLNTEPMPKYFIKGDRYFQEFKTERQARKEFNKLILTPAHP